MREATEQATISLTSWEPRYLLSLVTDGYKHVVASVAYLLYLPPSYPNVEELTYGCFTLNRIHSKNTLLGPDYSSLYICIVSADGDNEVRNLSKCISTPYTVLL